MKERYIWKKRPIDYKYDCYNNYDASEKKSFVVIDNETNIEYTIVKIGHHLNLPKELRNDDFIKWACSTSPDFYKEVIHEFYNRNVHDYVIENFEYPEIFSKYSRIIRTYPVDWQKLYKRNKEIARYVPIKALTYEMLEVLCELKNVELEADHYKILSPEMFEKIYFNCDKEYKLKLLNKKNKAFYISHGISTEFITKKVADDILNIDIATIWFIPDKHISKEQAIKAVEHNISLLEYVPAEFQTEEYQKKLVEKKASYISRISPLALTDNIIYYALTLNKEVISFIPDERKTFENCFYSIKDYPQGLKYVPDSIKNFAICFEAVSKDPNMLKYVPLNLINEQFVLALNNSGINMPSDLADYVMDCLHINNKILGEDIIVNELDEDYKRFDIDENYKKIELKFFPELFSRFSLEYLRAIGVETLYEFLLISQNRQYDILLSKAGPSTYKEIITAMKILNCMYLKIDPMIDITYGENTKLDDFCEKFNFDKVTTRILKETEMSPEIFFELLNDVNAEEKLKNIPRLGEFRAKQILIKTLPVINYYYLKNKYECSLNEEYRIRYLEKELEQKQKELLSIERRIDGITMFLNKIEQEKSNEGFKK